MLPRSDNWKARTMLKDLSPDEVLTFPRMGRPALITTPRELMGQGRICGSLFIDQVEWAFSELPIPKMISSPARRDG